MLCRNGGDSILAKSKPVIYKKYQKIKSSSETQTGLP